MNYVSSTSLHVTYMHEQMMNLNHRKVEIHPNHLYHLFKSYTINCVPLYAIFQSLLHIIIFLLNMAPLLSFSTIFTTYILLFTYIYMCACQVNEDPKGLGDPKRFVDPRGLADPSNLGDPRGLGDPSPPCRPPFEPRTAPIYPYDVDLLQFAENLEHLECDYFLWASLGYGLDVVAPYLTWGGPPPIGAQQASLDPLVRSIIREFGFEEVDHLRALKSTVGGYPRPLLDLSANNFARIMDEAMGYTLEPPFDPYRDSISYMLSAYIVPYMGLVGYVGMNPLLDGYVSKRLQAGLLGVESGQDAVIRTYLYERANKTVIPYNHTVAEFTIRISDLRNTLAACELKDEGIIVPPWLGAYNSSETNVLSANYYSLSYQRTPAEILRVVYGTGNERIPGGFFPKGGNGRIARQYLSEEFPPLKMRDNEAETESVPVAEP